MKSLSGLKLKLTQPGQSVLGLEEACVGGPSRYPRATLNKLLNSLFTPNPADLPRHMTRQAISTHLVCVSW